MSISLIIALFLGSYLLLTKSSMAQSAPCVFCQIAKEGKDSARVIFRDTSVVAFLSHGPVNTGHVLVIPLRHAARVEDVPDHTIRDMMSLARRMSMAIQKTNIKAEGFRYQINSGPAAGQEVFHVHMHVIPRYKDEQPPSARIYTSAELKPVVEKIKAALNDTLR